MLTLSDIKTKKRKQIPTGTPNIRIAVINEFFAMKQKTSQGEPWFNPNEEDAERYPKIIREIYHSLHWFFRKKRWYNGGSIPNELLFTRSNFRLLNNIAFVDAIDLAYPAIKKTKFFARSGCEYKNNFEIYLTLKLMRECGKKGIMQDHIGGILILYLILCERVVLS